MQLSAASRPARSRRLMKPGPATSAASTSGSRRAPARSASPVRAASCRAASPAPSRRWRRGRRGRHRAAARRGCAPGRRSRQTQSRRRSARRSADAFRKVLEDVHRSCEDSAQPFKGRKCARGLAQFGFFVKQPRYSPRAKRSVIPARKSATRRARVLSLALSGRAPFGRQDGRLGPVAGEQPLDDAFGALHHLHHPPVPIDLAIELRLDGAVGGRHRRRESDDRGRRGRIASAESGASQRSGRGSRRSRPRSSRVISRRISS